MEPTTLALLLVAGLAMGFVNNLAGAGGAIAWVALVEFAGLPDDTANVAMRPAAFAIGALGFLSFRRNGRLPPGRAWAYATAAVPGALAGAILAIELPPIVHQLALLAVLLLLAGRLLLARRGGDAEHIPRPLLGIALFALAGLHMGFVQVGTGLLVITALHAVDSRDLVAVNTAKMPVILLSSCTAVATLAARDAIPWGPALAVAAGAGAGSYLGARWSIAKGSRAVTRVVLTVMLAAMVWLLWQIRATLAAG